jgi:serine/threonine protein kinase
MGVSPGDAVAGWVVERVLGCGGMGTVYLARHPRLPRTDVLKVVNPALARRPEFRARFLREAESICALDHPNVVAVYDRGEDAGRLYIAMQYVRGGDLRGLLTREGRLPPERALALAGQVGGALDAAHRAGLVHRDVKPENVLLSERPTPETPDHAYLADFGITRYEAAGATLTDAGAVLGSPHYTAPEQVLGQRLDGRADVYSLGCLLFELLTGRVPYPRDGAMAALFAHVSENPPLLTSIRPDLPAGLDAVLARALAKAPGDRFDRCRDFIAAAEQADFGLRPGPELADRAPASVGPATLAAAGHAADRTRGAGGAGPGTAARPRPATDLHRPGRRGQDPAGPGGRRPDRQRRTRRAAGQRHRPGPSRRPRSRPRSTCRKAPTSRY